MGVFFFLERNAGFGAEGCVCSFAEGNGKDEGKGNNSRDSSASGYSEGKKKKKKGKKKNKGKGKEKIVSDNGEGKGKEKGKEKIVSDNGEGKGKEKGKEKIVSDNGEGKGKEKEVVSEKALLSLDQHKKWTGKDVKIEGKKDQQLISTIVEVEEGGVQLFPHEVERDGEYVDYWEFCPESGETSNYLATEGAEEYQYPGKPVSFLTETVVTNMMNGTRFLTRYAALSGFHQLPWTVIVQEDELVVQDMPYLNGRQVHVLTGTKIACFMSETLVLLDLETQESHETSLELPHVFDEPLFLFINDLLIVGAPEEMGYEWHFFRLKVRTKEERKHQDWVSIEKEEHNITANCSSTSTTLALLEKGKENQVGARFLIIEGFENILDIEEVSCTAPFEWQSRKVKVPELKNYLYAPVQPSTTIWHPSDGSSSQLILYGGTYREFSRYGDNVFDLPRQMISIDVETLECRMIPQSGNVPVHSRHDHIGVVLGDFLVIGMGEWGDLTMFDGGHVADWRIFDLRLCYWLDDVWARAIPLNKVDWAVVDNLIYILGGEYPATNQILSCFGTLRLPPQLLGEWNTERHRFYGQEFHDVVNTMLCINRFHRDESFWPCELPEEVLQRIITFVAADHTPVSCTSDKMLISATDVSYQTSSAFIEQFQCLPRFSGFLLMQARKERMVHMLKRHVWYYVEPYRTQVVNEMVRRGMITGADDLVNLEEEENPSLIRFKIPKICVCCGKIAAKVMTCSRCGIAKYCSGACQKNDWKSHKQSCNAK
eukprot:TRINITY_DN1294_c0_g1_i1.p1 TRINITY_DN1294_c0_g1~~TRINITY_DN1294_c0_g1_i1.p1  ORF type:complete len:769 (-),score=191.24 TRINITY_DN1294_c0_g1_i1:174-2480(-)